MTHATACAAVLLCTILSACAQTTAQRVAQQTAQVSGPGAPAAEESAPDEVAFALPPLPQAPAAPPAVTPAWVKRVQTAGTTDKDGKINLSAASVQPLYQAPGRTDTLFTQVNVHSSAQTTEPTGTSNIGVGYRRLLSRDLLLGVNGFYDRDWQENLDRTGADTEVKWKTFGMAFNYYDGRGDESSGKRALGGYDILIGSQVPYVPWAHTTFTHSEFDDANASGADSYGAGMKFDLLKYLQLDLGIRSEQKQPDAGMVKLSVNLSPDQRKAPRRTAFGRAPISDTALEDRDLSSTTLDRVQRISSLPSGE